VSAWRNRFSRSSHSSLTPGVAVVSLITGFIVARRSPYVSLSRAIFFSHLSNPFFTSKINSLVGGYPPPPPPRSGGRGPGVGELFCTNGAVRSAPDPRAPLRSPPAHPSSLPPILRARRHTVLSPFLSGIAFQHLCYLPHPVIPSNACGSSLSALPMTARDLFLGHRAKHFCTTCAAQRRACQPRCAYFVSPFLAFAKILRIVAAVLLKLPTHNPLLRRL